MDLSEDASHVIVDIFLMRSRGGSTSTVINSFHSHKNGTSTSGKDKRKRGQKGGTENGRSYDDTKIGILFLFPSFFHSFFLSLLFFAFPLSSLSSLFPCFFVSLFLCFFVSCSLYLFFVSCMLHCLLASLHACPGEEEKEEEEKSHQNNGEVSLTTVTIN